MTPEVRQQVIYQGKPCTVVFINNLNQTVTLYTNENRIPITNVKFEELEAVE